MLGSFKIGSVLGIHVRVHWLFVALVLFLVFWSGQAPDQDPLTTLLGLTVLFGVVFLHELGHSLVARRFGIRVLDITFWPLGGMARMSEIPESPRVEGLIAVAGPAVNFALAALAAPLVVWGLVDGRGAAPSELGATLGSLAATFLFVNLALGLFNLIPAFPMDGGRVLRAFLGRDGDWVRATERAVRVGRVFAVLMIAVGLLWSGSGFLFLPLIGLFVWYAGSRELWSVRMRHGLLPFGNAAARANGWAGPAPVEHAAPPPPEPAQRADGERNGARRPSDGLRGPELHKEGLGPSEIERLERYSGRLRRFGPSET